MFVFESERGLYSRSERYRLLLVFFLVWFGLVWFGLVCLIVRLFRVFCSFFCPFEVTRYVLLYTYAGMFFASFSPHYPVGT